MMEKKKRSKRFLSETPTTIRMENKSSKYKVKYTCYIYEEGKQVISRENGGNLNVGPVGAGLQNKTEYSKATQLKQETNIIQTNGQTDVAVSGSKEISIRYFFMGLQDDYTSEEINATIDDVVWFIEPTQKDIDEIHKIKEEEEQKKIKREAIDKNCSSLSKTMCSDMKNTPKKQCPRCDDWFCNHHHAINNESVYGGHLCPLKPK